MTVIEIIILEILVTIVVIFAILDTNESTAPIVTISTA